MGGSECSLSSPTRVARPLLPLSSSILHPPSFIPHPSSFILHPPSSPCLILPSSVFPLHSSSPHPTSFSHRPSLHTLHSSSWLILFPPFSSSPSDAPGSRNRAERSEAMGNGWVGGWRGGGDAGVGALVGVMSAPLQGDASAHARPRVRDQRCTTGQVSKLVDRPNQLSSCRFPFVLTAQVNVS